MSAVEIFTSAQAQALCVRGRAEGIGTGLHFPLV
jgi:hypothetical protein